MLQVTDAAVSVFQQYLEHPDVSGSAIRIEPREAAGGAVGIGFQPVEGAGESDAETEAPGIEVFVAPELAQPLEDVVLDARSSEGGAELFLRPQGEQQ
jgi:Fe-S cluster assembly iron-binding protein IscA